MLHEFNRLQDLFPNPSVQTPSLVTLVLLGSYFHRHNQDNTDVFIHLP